MPHRSLSRYAFAVLAGIGLILAGCSGSSTPEAASPEEYFERVQELHDHQERQSEAISQRFTDKLGGNEASLGEVMAAMEAVLPEFLPEFRTVLGATRDGLLEIAAPPEVERVHEELIAAYGDLVALVDRGSKQLEAGEPPTEVLEALFTDRSGSELGERFAELASELSAVAESAGIDGFVGGGALVVASSGSGEVIVENDGSGGEGEPRVALLPEFTMRVGDVVLLGGTDEALRFAGVAQDSRCPADVTCVWAGEALLAFELLRSGATEVIAAIAVPVSPTDGAAVLGALRVRAIALTPAPRSTEPIAQDRYKATVVVEPLTPPAAESGVHGVVTLGPLCPVQRVDRPCPDRPFVATLLLVDSGGNEVARTISGADGAYWLPAPAGSYTLTPQPVDGRPLPAAGEASAMVRTGHWTTVNVPYDSGIR